MEHVLFDRGLADAEDEDDVAVGLALSQPEQGLGHARSESELLLRYASNLTPGPETGLGDWTAAEFIAALCTGKHRGTGHPILPPMPWQPLGEATDSDLQAIFAYLRTLTPVRNRVPKP